MKFNKKHLCRIGILLGIYALMVLMLMRFQYAYGSNLDWNGQHYAIPDYFRKLFYETGKLFPSFAPNIGAGENIYYLSYYGLYSPIILFSYLFPFIKMSTYIQAVSIIGIAVDIVLFYIFISRKFKDNTAFLLSVLFTFSGCLIFHSHRHIMFINYMPFLLLGLMAVEDYFTKGRNIKVTIYSFLIILCSYYFSIPALLAMTVYGIYCYIKTHEKVTLKDFITCGAGFALRIITGILMAGVLLLPTLAVMLGGRDKTNTSVDIMSLIPKVSLNFISSDTYSMGLSCFLITACIMGIMSKNRARKFLSIVFALLISCPVFVYILNAGMYIEPKVLIPFMPIGIVLIGQAYCDFADGNYKSKPVFIATIIALIWGILFFEGKTHVKTGVYIDSAILIICLLLFFIYNKKGFIKFAIVGFTCVATLISNFSDNMPTLKNLEYNNSDEINSLADIASQDENPVRTSNLINRSKTPNHIYNGRYYNSTIYSSLHNENYNHFYFEEIKNENEFRNSALTTASKSVLFNFLMGEKYLITDENTVNTGYEKVKTLGDVSLYKNDKVLPLGYASSKTLNLSDYEKLTYPERVEALTKYIIVPENGSEQFISNLKKCENLKFETSDGITANNGEYSIDSNKKIKSQIQLDHPLKKDEVLLLKFNVDNSQKKDKNDAKITVNGITNTLTTPSWKYFNHNNSFEYVITTGGKDEINCLEIELSKGVYKISDVQGYVMDYPTISSDIDCFKAEKDKSKGDFIEGNIDCKNDSYFQLSIPYEKGFYITVDGNEQQYQMTDTAFIGFPISKGHHHIKIQFKDPLLNVGKIVSLAGIFLLFITILTELILKRKNRIK